MAVTKLRSIKILIEWIHSFVSNAYLLRDRISNVEKDKRFFIMPLSQQSYRWLARQLRVTTFIRRIVRLNDRKTAEVEKERLVRGQAVFSAVWPSTYVTTPLLGAPVRYSHHVDPKRTERLKLKRGSNLLKHEEVSRIAFSEHRHKIIITTDAYRGTLFRQIRMITFDNLIFEKRHFNQNVTKLFVSYVMNLNNIDLTIIENFYMKN